MTTQNLGNAQSQNWLLTIGNNADVSYRTKNFVLPTVSCGTTVLGGTGTRQLVTVGDHLELDDLLFDFHIDSQYKNYEKIYNWINDNVKSDTTNPQDISIALLDANGHSQGLVIVYVDAWPIMLSMVPLDAENADTDLQASITFKYDYFYFERR